MRITVHRLRLAARLHGGDEDVVAVHDVVDHRHRRPVLAPGVAEDAGPVIPHELASLVRFHLRPPFSCFSTSCCACGEVRACPVSRALLIYAPNLGWYKAPSVHTYARSGQGRGRTA